MQRRLVLYPRMRSSSSMRSRNWPMTSSFRNGRDPRQQTDAMESTELCGGGDGHDDGVETATYEDGRDSGPLTAARSGPTPSTAKRFRSTGVMSSTLHALLVPVYHLLARHLDYAEPGADYFD